MVSRVKNARGVRLHPTSTLRIIAHQPPWASAREQKKIVENLHLEKPCGLNLPPPPGRTRDQVVNTRTSHLDGEAFALQLTAIMATLTFACPAFACKAPKVQVDVGMTVDRPVCFDLQCETIVKPLRFVHPLWNCVHIK